MNFEGRYKTNNGTVVAVHRVPNPVGVEVWYGHDLALLPKHQPMEYDPIKRYTWDEMGDCVTIYGWVGPTFDFNLNEVVNPQGPEWGMKVEGCEECERWQKKQIG